MALRAISGRALLPILSGVLLDAGDNLLLRATDLEMGLEVKVPAQVEEAGRVVLPGKIIGEMVRSLPGTTASLETSAQDNQARLRCGDLCLQVATFDADQFPPMGTNLADAVSYNLQPDFLSRVAKCVAVAAAKDDIRGVFSGLLWEDAGDGQVTIVGTDTYRMAWMEAEVEREPGLAVRAVIPARAVFDAARIEGGDTPIRLSFTDSHAVFTFPEVLITCRLFGMTFPDFRMVIPTNFATRITCLGHELAQAVERAALLAKEEESKDRANLVSLRVYGNNINISSQASQLGTFVDTVPAQIEGEEGTLTFNARYLVEGLKIYEGGVINMQVASGFDGVIINSAELPGVNYHGLPVSLN